MKSSGKGKVTPNQVALTFVVLGDLGLLIMILFNVRGWMAMVFGIIAAIGVSGWLGTSGRTRKKK